MQYPIRQPTSLESALLEAVDLARDTAEWNLMGVLLNALSALNHPVGLREVYSH